MDDLKKIQRASSFAEKPTIKQSNNKQQVINNNNNNNNNKRYKATN